MTEAIAFLAVTTVILQGFLSIANLLVEYRENGKVTKWGRRALIVTVTLLILSAGLSLVQEFKRRRDVAEDAKRAEAQLATTQRSVGS